MKKHYFTIGLYGERIRVYVGTAEEYVKSLKKEFDIDKEKPMKNGEYCFCEYMGKEDGFKSFHSIWVDSFSSSPRDICLMTHEVLHCTFNLLDRVGMSHSEESEEAYTYLMQYIMLEISSEFLEEKKCQSTTTKKQK